MKYVNKIFKSRYIIDIFTTLIGTFVFRIVGLLLSLYISKIVNAAQYGVFSTIKSFSAIFYSILSVGLHVTLISYLSSDKNSTKNKILFLNWGVGNFFIISLVVFVLTIFVWNVFDFEFLQYIIFTFIYAFAFSLDRVGISIIQGLHKFKFLLRLNIFASVVYILLVTVFLWNWGILGALIGISLVLLIRFVIVYKFFIYKMLSLKYMFVPFKRGMFFLDKTRKHSYLILVGEVVFTLCQFVSVWLLKSYADYANVGTFSLCMLLFSMLLFFVSSTSNVFLSYLSKQNDIIKFFLKNITINVLVVFIPSIIILYYFKSVQTIFNIDYPFFYETLFLIIISAVFEIIGVFSDKILYFFDKTMFIQTINSIRQILILIFTILFLINWRADSIGAALGFLITAILVNIIKMYYSIIVVSGLVHKKEKIKKGR